MSYHCIPCDKSFGDAKSLSQHVRDSPRHASSFNCEACRRTFGSGEALEQHLRDSPVHAPSFDCDDCDRAFDSEEVLQQHIRDSPAHAPSFDCGACNRFFGSEEALQQHLRDSPVHAPSFDCDNCDRAFNSEEALQQHIRDSPAHAPSFECGACDRSFGSEEALQQHRRDSRIHGRDLRTPLDAFFRSFPTFGYDPSLPPNSSYANLREHQGWRRGDTESDNAWTRYQDALNRELDMWYGAEDDLTAWHALCRAIGIEPPPTACEQCEKAARNTHVNIVDLIACGRSGNQEKVRTFRNVEELRAYTLETGKIYQNTLHQESGNVVLRHLLRKLLRRGPRR